MALPNPVLVTEEEFLALPETNERVEFIDGDVIVPPSPTGGHQRKVVKLSAALETWAETADGDFVVFVGPMDVRFAPGRILQPDVFVLDGTFDPDAHQVPIQQTPLLCVEVLSGDRTYDRVTKRQIYADAGVAEYWVVHPTGVVERFSGERLQQAQLVNDVLTSALLPGFSLDLAKLAR